MSVFHQNWTQTLTMSIIFAGLGFMRHPFQLFSFQDLISTFVPSPVCIVRALVLINGSSRTKLLTDRSSCLIQCPAVSVTAHKTNTSLFPILLSSLTLSIASLLIWGLIFSFFLWYRCVGFYHFSLSLSLSLSGMCLMVWRHAHSTDIDWNVWTTLDQVLGVLLLLCQQQRNHWPVRIFSGL